MYNSVMDNKRWLLAILATVALVAIAIGGYVNMQNKSTISSSNGTSNTKIDGTSSTGKLEDIKVTYVVNADAQKLYNISVTTGEQTGSQQSVRVHGKACNTMNGSIEILPKGKKSDKTVVKTLDDGRQVLEPMVASTMMACMEDTPATDDQALTKEINAIAASLQSD